MAFRKIRNIIMLILIIITLLIIFLVSNMGRWLVTEDRLQESDVIVALTGCEYNRTLQAVDLYNERYSDKIVIPNSGGAVTEIESGTPSGSAKLMKMTATDLGVAAENIIILEGHARSTQDEAIILLEYLRNNKTIESIIIVTSQYHSRRAKIIFTKALSFLDRVVKIYSSPSKYDTFNASQWWLSKQDIRLVASEYLKIAHFYFLTQFQLN